MNEKYRTCRHAEAIGQFAVFVRLTCKRATMIRGTLVSSKKRCQQCNSWEPEEGKERERK